jgi:thioredoxin-related protein
MTANFSQRAIVDKTRKNFVAIALNLWGDREVTWIDGRVMTEKELARVLNVQFTPTLLFLDEKGAVVVRLNGYYPPQRFEAVLDYVAGRLERREPLPDYLGRAAREPASSRLHEEPFFLRPPYDLRRTGDKPLAVLFETTDCSACDELHREGFQRGEVLAQVKRVDVARFALGAHTELTTPAGRKTSAEAWARELNVTYAPTVIFFDGSGSEVFRIEAYMRPFHFASSFAYVTSGAYRAEPSFQRYLQGRAGEMRARGERVELWK